MSSADLPKSKPLKCVLVGPPKAGKTAFLVQLIDQTFDQQYTATICTNFSKYKHTNNYYFDLWEVSGQFAGHLLPMYLRGANIILLFVNPSSNGTNDWRVDFGQFFNAFSSQISSLYNDCESKDIPRFAFVCTHSDQPYVNIDHLEDFQTELTKIVKHKVPLFHVSSLNGLGINEIISSLFDSPGSSPDSHIMDSHIEVDNEEKKEKKGGKSCTIM